MPRVSYSGPFSWSRRRSSTSGRVQEGQLKRGETDWSPRAFQMNDLTGSLQRDFRKLVSCWLGSRLHATTPRCRVPKENAVGNPGAAPRRQAQGPIRGCQRRPYGRRSGAGIQLSPGTLPRPCVGQLDWHSPPVAARRVPCSDGIVWLSVSSGSQLRRSARARSAPMPRSWLDVCEIRAVSPCGKRWSC